MAANPEWTWYPNQTRLAQASLVPALLSDGWVPLSLCLHTVAGSLVSSPDHPFYTTLWVRWPSGPGPPTIKHFLLGDRESAHDWMANEATHGRYPFLVGAGGVDFPRARFSVFTSSSARPAHRDLDMGRPVRPSTVILGTPIHDEVDDDLGFQFEAGRYPEWVAPYGHYPKNCFMAVIWREQPSRGGPSDPLYSEGWVQRGLNVMPNHDVAQANGALVSSFAYPRVLGIVKGTDPQTPGHVMLHDNDAIDGIGQVLDLHTVSVGGNRLQQKMDELATAGLWPISLMGSDAGDNQRFNIVYATCGHLAPPQRLMRTPRLTMSGVTETQASATSGASLGGVEGFAITRSLTVLRW